MPVDSFDQWFAKYLGQDAYEVTRLLNDKTAIRFLIAWSIFESCCFGGFAKVEKFEAFVSDFFSAKGFKPSEIRDAANQFHKRYQDKELYGNLMWEQKSSKLNSILSKYFEALSADEIVYFVIFVVYRYRNNIFHGNKGVGSWLKFNDQIELCIKIMQTLITFVVEELHKAAKQGDANAQETLSKLSIDWRKIMLPEEQELIRLEAEQAELEEQVTTAELTLETSKTETAQFQHRYHQTVGRLYAQLDELDAQIARVQAGLSPDDVAAQAHAQAAEQQAKASAEEAGLIEAQPAPPLVITPELKLVFRQAAKLMHPDRATSEPERLRRTALMAQVNLAYERGDQPAIEKLINEYGQDPEAIVGEDVASRIVQAIRRIAQLRRRMGEVQQQMDEMQQTEIFELKQITKETEAMGGDPLGDLAKQLMQELSERKIQLELARHGQ